MNAFKGDGDAPIEGGPTGQAVIAPQVRPGRDWLDGFLRGFFPAWLCKLGLRGGDLP